jgi:hypothetical protein
VVKDMLGMPFSGATVSMNNDNSAEAEATLDKNGEVLRADLQGS